MTQLSNALRLCAQKVVFWQTALLFVLSLQFAGALCGQISPLHMSFSLFLQQKRLAALVEDAVRARLTCSHDAYTLSFSQILPVHDLRLQLQCALVCSEMTTDSTLVYRQCQQILKEDRQHNKNDLHSFILNLLGVLIDNRVYSGLCKHFGAVYAFVENGSTENVLALRNIRERRDRPVLMLHFTVAEPQKGAQYDGASTERIGLLHAMQISNGGATTRTNSASLPVQWLRTAWQRTKSKIWPTKL